MTERKEIIKNKKEKEITVKGYRIGEGKPLICVPVMKKDRNEVLWEAARLTGEGIPMLEWRLDAYEDLSTEGLAQVLQALQPLVKETILLATFRSAEEGGLRQLPAEEMKRIRRQLAESEAVDFVDLEYYQTKKPQKEIAAIQKRGSYVIVSSHDFEKTPPGDVLRQRLEEMRDSGADVVKLAVMPADKEDVLGLIHETVYFHNVNPDCPIITMSMGDTGCISRIVGEFSGSCVTFGSAGEASAPGQLPVRSLEKVLDILHGDFL